MASRDSEPEQLPSYSLLETHETIVKYAIPDPTDRTNAYLMLRLFSWELVDENQSGTSEFRLDEPDREGKVYDGIGFGLSFNRPADVREKPPHVKDWVKSNYDTFSHGSGQNGPRFRLEDVTPGEIRSLAQNIAQYSFCYWWALDQSDDYDATLQRKESHRERRQRLDIVEDVRPDGTVIYTDGEGTATAPYRLDDIELLHEDEWQTPEERCEQTLEETLADLKEEFDYYTVREAFRNVEVTRPASRKQTKTDELKEFEALQKTLREVDPDGVGRQTRRKIANEFGSIDAVVADIEADGPTLREIRAVGDKTFESIRDAFANHDYLDG